MDEKSRSEPQNPIEIPARYAGITLRQFSIGDAPAIFALIDQDRQRFVQPGVKAGETYKTLKDVEDSITNPKDPNRLRFGIWNNANEYIGTINLTPDKSNPQRAEIGYYLGRQYEGKGYMLKAVNTLVSWAFKNKKIEEIYGMVNKGNIESDRSVNVLRHAGFEETGVEWEERIFTLTKPQR